MCWICWHQGEVYCILASSSWYLTNILGASQQKCQCIWSKEWKNCNFANMIWFFLCVLNHCALIFTLPLQFTNVLYYCAHTIMIGNMIWHVSVSIRSWRAKVWLLLQHYLFNWAWGQIDRPLLLLDRKGTKRHSHTHTQTWTFQFIYSTNNTIFF